MGPLKRDLKRQRINFSTVAQGRSGLGLDAQRATIAQFATAEGLEIAEHAGAGLSWRGNSARWQLVSEQLRNVLARG
jgi:hypothetical protein